MAVQTAVKQELKKANAAAAVTQMSVAGMGGEEQGAAARGTPDTDGTGTAARKSEKVSHVQSLVTVYNLILIHKLMSQTLLLAKVKSCIVLTA